jgi:hypothetical protein
MFMSALSTYEQNVMNMTRFVSRKSLSFLDMYSKLLDMKKSTVLKLQLSKENPN